MAGRSDRPAIWAPNALMPASDKPGTLPGLGPKSTEWLAEVGITTVAELREVGAIAAYRRLKHWNPRLVSLNALYALHAAVHGLHWRAVDDATKARLRAEAADPGPPAHSR
jgi:DNA transformation protein